jgi:hypothetical protein
VPGVRGTGSRQQRLPPGRLRRRGIQLHRVLRALRRGSGAPARGGPARWVEDLPARQREGAERAGRSAARAAGVLALETRGERHCRGRCGRGRDGFPACFLSLFLSPLFSAQNKQETVRNVRRADLEYHPSNQQIHEPGKPPALSQRRKNSNCRRPPNTGPAEWVITKNRTPPKKEGA